MSEVVIATRDDLPLVTASLARAFADDPVLRYLIPTDPDHRRTALGFRMLGLNALDRGMVIESIQLEHKAGGRTGEWSRTA